MKRQPYIEETTQESIHLNHMNIKKSSKFLEWGIQNQDIFSHSNITDFNFYSFFRWNFRVNFKHQPEVWGNNSLIFNFENPIFVEFDIFFYSINIPKYLKKNQYFIFFTEPNLNLCHLPLSTWVVIILSPRRSFDTLSLHTPPLPRST